MSVGGKIKEVIKINDKKIWVNTINKRDECAIFLDSNHLDMLPGDSLWWQSGKAYWTSNNYKTEDDIPFKKIGFSGVSRKNALMQALEEEVGIEGLYDDLEKLIEGG